MFSTDLELLRCYDLTSITYGRPLVGSSAVVKFIANYLHINALLIGLYPSIKLFVNGDSKGHTQTHTSTCTVDLQALCTVQTPRDTWHTTDSHSLH